MKPLLPFVLGALLSGPGIALPLIGSPASEMAGAANRWLASLDTAQRAKATFAFTNEERENWHFVPLERRGLPVKEMTAEQVKLAHALLQTALSRTGYNKATNIMSLESILAEMEGPKRTFPRDPSLYHFWIFGDPTPTGTWGWRAEGHHVSINVTIVDGKAISVTPSFLGTNPGEVRQGPRKGLRVLGDEEDLGRALVKSLDGEQRKIGIISPVAPKDVFTEQKRHVTALEAVGIYRPQLTSAQKATLQKLIDTYLQRYRREFAKADWKKISQAGVDKIQFAWYGGVEPGEGHYYRVQGPTFLLEYDNTQNNNNHAHAVWRDFANDFGEDLLRQHYQRDHHP